MGKRYRIVLERQNCIGAGACVLAHPERWALDKNDDKVNLSGARQMGDGSWEIECTEEEFERFMDAATVCPVNVIHIIDLQTGERLI